MWRPLLGAFFGAACAVVLLALGNAHGRAETRESCTIGCFGKEVIFTLESSMSDCWKAAAIISGIVVLLFATIGAWAGAYVARTRRTTVEPYVGTKGT